MINEKIIFEFEKLLLFIQKQIDSTNEDKNKFRYKNLKNALNVIKKFPEEITINNLNNLKIPGIGKGTIERIAEILKNGFLSELKDFNNDSNNEKIINELENIVGIGRSKALELVNEGIKSIDDLKNKIEKGKIKVNDKILLGLKYHNKFFGNIPRQEITDIKNLLNNIIIKMNKNLNDNDKYILKICGSYRRGKLTSGDIDILLTKKNYSFNDSESNNHLVNFIKLLKKPIKLNNNKPFIVDDMTDKNYETKYMGFCKYLDNPFRRIDIRFIPWKSYYTALLYFTGSAEHNKKMRKIAQQMNYKLSEYSLIDLTTNNEFNINSEKKIFELLNMEYIKPNLRL
jgi:DNA polymerase/3'-5' exonuclease PolX